MSAESDNPSVVEEGFRSSASPFGTGSLKSWNVVNPGPCGAPGFELAAPEPAAEESYPSVWTAKDGAHFLSFEDVARFRVCFDERTITVFDVAADATSAALSHLLYDHVAPRILSGLGELVLHGSAVEIDGKLAVFLGDTGAGKSTLAASLHQRGYRLLGDDAVVVKSSPGGFTGEAVYPSLRLYPESITATLGEGIDSAPMAHYSNKQRVELPSLRQSDPRPVPIAGLFFLMQDPQDPTPAVYPLNESQTCVALIEHSFAIDPLDAPGAARRLQQITGLVRSLPGYELSYPLDFEVLPRVHDLIRTCIEQSDGSTPEFPKASAA